MHVARVNKAPAITKPVGVIAFDMKSLFRLVLKNRHGVVASFNEQIDGFRAEQCRVKPVKENGPAAALCMSDLSGEDGFFSGLAAAILLEVTVSKHFDQFHAKRLSRATQCDIA